MASRFVNPGQAYTRMVSSIRNAITLAEAWNDHFRTLDRYVRIAHEAVHGFRCTRRVAIPMAGRQNAAGFRTPAEGRDVAKFTPQ